MRRFTISLAAAVLMTLVPGGVAMAGGGHHHGHHHVGHFHSGLHVGFGLGHANFGGHHDYHSYGHSYYSYPGYHSSYFYPSYSSNSYYRSQTYCSPRVIYVQPVQSRYAPPAPTPQYQIPTGEPAPSTIPLPSATAPERRIDSTAGFTDRAQVSDLGPLLAVPSARPLVSDDEMPWVVDETSPAPSESNTKVAVTGESTDSR